jgi:hypothetical protein
MRFRWTEDALAQFEKRRQEWMSKGTVRTNEIARPAETSPAASKARSKYGAVRTEADGHKFASKKEANRWMDLRLLEHAGHVQELKRQVPYELEVNGITICTYIADFVYRKGAELVVEDTKGMKTPLYLLKAKLMLALHGIVILET